MRIKSVLLVAAFVLAGTPAFAQLAGPMGSPLAVTAGARAGNSICANEERAFTLEQAIQSCTTIINSRPGRSLHADTLRNRAAHYEDQGALDLARADYDAALVLYTAEIEGARREPQGYVGRGWVNYRLGRIDAARADFEQAIAVDNDAASAYYGRGVLLFRAGDYAAASAAFDQASHTAARHAAPAPAAFLSGKCIARAAAGSATDQVANLCNRAVRRAEGAAEALVARGFYHFRAGDLAKAGQDFVAAANHDPHDGAALYGRGVIATRLGRDGSSDITRGRELDPVDVAFYSAGGLTP
jgi:tetratricopeptide (TPR) repeat protein